MGFSYICRFLLQILNQYVVIIFKLLLLDVLIILFVVSVRTFTWSFIYEFCCLLNVICTAMVFSTSRYHVLVIQIYNIAINWLLQWHECKVELILFVTTFRWRQGNKNETFFKNIPLNDFHWTRLLQCFRLSLNFMNADLSFCTKIAFPQFSTYTFSPLNTFSFFCALFDLLQIQSKKMN